MSIELIKDNCGCVQVASDSPVVPPSPNNLLVAESDNTIRLVSEKTAEPLISEQ